MAGSATCSGEGGMLEEEQAANSRYFYELASAKFGWSLEKVKRCQAFHFKGGQGAKTGTGGHLPGEKVVGKIAQVRNLAEGRAVIISSHILGEISQTCDRILVVNQGRLIAQGTEDELAPERGRRLVLTVRGQRVELQAFLDEQAGIDTFDLQDEEPGCVQARLTLAADTREVLVAALIGAGFGLRSLVEPEDELESIFLKLTSQEAA